MTVFFRDGQYVTVTPDDPLPISGTFEVEIPAPPAPEGGATEDKQDAGNASLAAIDADLGAPADAAASSDTGTFSIIALIKRLLQKLPQLTLTGTRLQVSAGFPEISGASIIAVQTAAVGTNYAAFASTACTALDIVNNTGTTIEYRRGGAGETIRIPNGAARLILGITNANQIDVRRADTSNTQVSVRAEAFS